MSSEHPDFKKTSTVLEFIEGLNNFKFVFESRLGLTGKDPLKIPITLMEIERSRTDFLNALLDLQFKGKIETLTESNAWIFRTSQVGGIPQATLTIMASTDDKYVLTCTPMTEADQCKLYDEYLLPSTTFDETIQPGSTLSPFAMMQTP